MRSLLTRFMLLLALLWSPPSMAWALGGQVVAIVSGDTLQIRDEKRVRHTVRLAGLDAPEKFQAYGQRSLDSLRELVFQRYVTIEFARQGATRAGRVLMQGQDINCEQLQRGMAWYASAQAADLSAETRSAYAAVEAEARLQRAGLWRDAKPVAPWEYRQGRRK